MLFPEYFVVDKYIIHTYKYISKLLILRGPKPMKQQREKQDIFSFTFQKLDVAV